MLQLSCRLRVFFVLASLLSSTLILTGQNASKNSPPPLSFSIPFSQSVTGSHIKMGLPLPSGVSPRQVSLYDDEGMYVQADIFPLESWPGISQTWALLAFPAISQKGEQTAYTLRFDKVAPPQEEGIKLEELPDGKMRISNFFYSITLSPEGIQSMGSASSDPVATGWKAGILGPEAKDLASPAEKGSVEVIYNGNLYKKVRLVQPMTKGLTIYQELDLFANSPYIQFQTRFLNTHSEDISFSGILPLQINFGEGIAKSAIGIQHNNIQQSASFSLHQSYHDWLVAMSEGENVRGNQGALGEWVSLELANGVKTQWVFPHFQEMAAQYPDRESLLSFKNNTLKVHHYKPLTGEHSSTMTLPSGQSRSFSSWIVINPIEEDWERHAEICKNLLPVTYDRTFISKSELLPENGEDKHYDAYLEALALRSSTPATVSINQSYPSPFQLHGLDYGWNMAAQDQKSSPSFSWDISRAMVQSYLRLGRREIGASAFQYAMLQADRGVNRNPLSNLPSTHPTATDQAEGLVAAYHVWGEPWFRESAEIVAKKAGGSSRGGNAEAPPALDFSQGNSLGGEIKPSEDSFSQQALYAYAQTVSFEKSKNPASFYLANAAWFELVEAEQDAQSIESSLSLVQGLPLFAGLAQENGFPFVVQASGEAEGSLSQMRMNPNASWDGKVFSFALVRTPEKAESLPAHTGSLDIELSFPVTKISYVKIDGEKVEFAFDTSSSSLTFSLGAANSQKSYQIEVGGR